MLYPLYVDLLRVLLIVYIDNSYKRLDWIEGLEF